VVTGVSAATPIPGQLLRRRRRAGIANFRSRRTPKTPQRPTRPKPTRALRSRSEGVSPPRIRRPCGTRTHNQWIKSPGVILLGGSGRCFGVRNRLVRTRVARCTVSSVMASAAPSAHASLTQEGRLNSNFIVAVVAVARTAQPPPANTSASPSHHLTSSPEPGLGERAGRTTSRLCRTGDRKAPYGTGVSMASGQTCRSHQGRVGAAANF
jgi:hypothetical protein